MHTNDIVCYRTMGRRVKLGMCLMNISSLASEHFTDTELLPADAVNIVRLLTILATSRCNL